MEKVKWGVLGTADIARGCTIPGMQLAENCEMYAIAGRSLEKAESFKSEFGFEKAYGSYDELLNDPEIQAVYIPLPNDIHYEWVMKAMKAGKNVLCEKPLAPTAKQVKELFDAAKECGVLLMEAFAYLHTPYIAALKEEISSGAIGDVCYVESAFVTQGHTDANIRMRKETYGGALYDLGCYSTSMILTLLDKDAVSVQGIAEYTDKGIDINTAANLILEGNVRASINCGMVLGEADGRIDRLYVYGSKGYIRSYTEFNQAGDLKYSIVIDGKEEVKSVHCEHNYRLEVEQLGRCILNGEKPHVSADFSIRNASMLDDILDAIGYNKC